MELRQREIRGGVASRVAVVLTLVLLGGCGSAKVTPPELPGPKMEPDMVVVKDFAVTMAEVKLDKHLVEKTLKNAPNADLTEEEVNVGHAVSEKLAQTLVDELNEAGIKAVRAGEAQPSRRSVIVDGQFLSIDEGNRTQRIVVGFGLGRSMISTEVEMIQGGRLVASAETTAKSGLKPGMLIGAGATVATGGGAAPAMAGSAPPAMASGAAPLVASGASTGVNEAFFATVKADASRTAKALAKKIKETYVNQGWLEVADAR